MRLFLKGHDYRYAAEQIMLTFFPEERPEYVKCRADLGKEGAAVTLSAGARYITAGVTLFFAGERYWGGARTKARDFAGKLERDSIQNQLIKRAFYLAAVRATGKKPAWGAMTGIRPAKIATKLLESGCSALQAERVLAREYFVSPSRRRLCMAAAQAGQALKQTVDERDISLYVGIPFCPTRCAYCSFVSNSVERSQELVEPYLNALFKEIEYTAGIVRGLNLRVKSVYIGGGTPTTLSARQLERLDIALRRSFDLSALPEYTVEAGRPDTVDAEKLAALKAAGVTRVSVNPQTMIDSVLGAIGRKHSAKDIVRACEQVRAAGFGAVNMDLIAGLPTDDVKGFMYSLDEVLSLEPENITVHTLSVKRGSDLNREKTALPGQEAVSAMLDYAMEKLTENAYAPYYLYRQKYMAGNFENIGWSRSGRECLYNIYIMEELHTILSFGAGATTKLVDPYITRIERIFNPKYPYEYMENSGRLLEAKKYIPEYYAGMKKGGAYSCI